jgi:hypothetical protein
VGEHLSQWLESARALHEKSVVVDSHCDTTQRLTQPGWDFLARHNDGHVDVPRLQAGGVGAVLLPFMRGLWRQAKDPKPRGLTDDELAVKRHADSPSPRTADDVCRARTWAGLPCSSGSKAVT